MGSRDSLRPNSAEHLCTLAAASPAASCAWTSRSRAGSVGSEGSAAAEERLVRCVTMGTSTSGAFALSVSVALSHFAMAVPAPGGAAEGGGEPRAPL